MPKYMFLQRSNCDQQPNMTPEQMQEHMTSWMEWMKQGTDAGWLLDPGSALSSECAIVESDLSITDGPFAEAKELVGGYTIVEASDLAAACELAQQTMKLAGSGRIEVRPFAIMPGGGQ